MEWGELSSKWVLNKTTVPAILFSSLSWPLFSLLVRRGKGRWNGRSNKLGVGRPGLETCPSLRTALQRGQGVHGVFTASQSGDETEMEECWEQCCWKWIFNVSGYYLLLSSLLHPALEKEVLRWRGQGSRLRSFYSSVRWVWNLTAWWTVELSLESLSSTGWEVNSRGASSALFFISLQMLGFHLDHRHWDSFI